MKIRRAALQCLAMLGVPEDRVVVTIVSRLVRHKGHPELIAAMRDVPDCELWVVGERLTTDRGADTFGFEQAKRLKSATVGGTSATYTYDAQGKRFDKTPEKPRYRLASPRVAGNSHKFRCRVARLLHTSRSLRGLW